ncbi:YacL family protein [Shewanella ulleungensis]|uniref:YacL family protein n=1 Tax=Shewanella ulleungensis TaxID=2282699 RepID=UPI003D78D393
MEYQFRRNRLEGTVFAEFSMDHEVLGRWFAEELGDDNSRANSILTQIILIKTGGKNHWRHVGADLTIDIDTEQVRVFANVIDFEEEHDLDEAMNLYDAESESYCGLEDFESVLQSWLAFINQK